MYNDDWMRTMGYLDKTGLVARDLVASRPGTRLVTLDRADTVSRAVQVMTEHDYSQIPVTDGGRVVGAVSETRLYAAIVADPEVTGRAIEAVMQPAFPYVDITTGVDALAQMITPETPAVLVRDFRSEDTYIITRWDVMKAMAR
jgi:cystathionine beta-synthase